MRFLFCSLDSPGFLFPAMGLALELKANRHEVAFATNTICEKWLVPQGLKRIQRGDQDGNSFQNSVWGQPWAVAIQVKHLEYAVQQFEPDVLVGQQLTLGALIVAERHNIPVALIGFSIYLWPTDRPETDEETAQRKAWRFKDMVERYNAIRRMFCLQETSSDYMRTGLLGDLFMVRNIPEFERGYEELPDRVHLIGPCLWEPSGDDPELEQWIAEAERLGWPVLYVQQGRFFDRPHFWPKVMEILALQPWRIAASTGSMDCEQGAVPGNFFVKPHVPQGQVLRRAQAMIASGNTTAVLGALVEGVPSLLIPAGGEQPDVAERCRHAGTARVLLPTGITPESLLMALTLVMKDTNMAAKTQSLGQSFRAANNFQTGRILLENLATTRLPVLRLEHLAAEVGAS